MHTKKDCFVSVLQTVEPLEQQCRAITIVLSLLVCEANAMYHAEFCALISHCKRNSPG